ncbi:MAG: acyl carrier protein [Salinivirgaceae bacterium]|nr:acyl carrier protein [Salinivirgaceae bacterium]MBR5957088.1 acyl carrier protein [Salinivirgaceae bacterium]
MEKQVRLGVYRVLRKVGVNRQYIYPEASFTNDLFFDDIDWKCFLCFVEEQFNIEINDEEAQRLVTVENTIELVNKRLSLN